MAIVFRRVAGPAFDAPDGRRMAPIEDFADAATGAELARAANDALADLTSAHSDRFAGFIAALSMLDPEAAATEATRACQELGAKGVQMFTNVAGRQAPLYLCGAELVGVAGLVM